MWHGQGVVQVGPPTGVQGGRGAAPGVTHAGGAARRLLHVLLELLKVALVLGAPVLEPANDLKGGVSLISGGQRTWRWKETVVKPLLDQFYQWLGGDCFMAMLYGCTGVVWISCMAVVWLSCMALLYGY